MLLEDIEKEWAADTIINPLKLTDESIKIPKLHAKYSTFINKERMVFIKLKSTLEEKEYILEQYYKKTLTIDELNQYKLPLVQDKKVSVPEIPKVIANTKEVVDLKNRMGAQNIKIEFLESIIKSIHTRNWVIKDAIEWRKFESGS
jgi:hypothetical protein